MDQVAEENRRAVLDLYKAFFERSASILLALSVIFFSEVQAERFLGLWLFRILALLTMAAAVDRLAASSYWNRRVQQVMTDDTEVPEGADSLKWLDFHYWEVQTEAENSSENPLARLVHSWSHFRIKPKDRAKALEYLDSFRKPGARSGAPASGP